MLAAKKGLTVETIKPEDAEASAIAESFEPDHIGAAKMERSSGEVPFPALANPATYQPQTIPFRTSKHGTVELTPTEKLWVEVFRRSIPSFKQRAADDTSIPDAAKQAEKFAERYNSILNDFVEDPESHGGPPDIILLCRIRETILRELGFGDIFKTVKAEENEKALKHLPGLFKSLDAIEDESERVDFLLKGLLAGNVFDLGATSTSDLFDKGELTFESSFQKLLPRPWAVDNVEAFKAAWTEKRWRKAVIFCDNAGADTILGVLPFARELVKTGAQVVLAANEVPAINDMTYNELLSVLAQIQTSIEDEALTLALDRGSLLIVNSGSDLPVLDLSSLSPELAFASDGVELVVFVGMGRGIETNLNSELTCDSLNIGMIKHQEVAEFLKGRLYDGVVKYTPVEMPPTPSRRIKQPASLN